MAQMTIDAAVRRALVALVFLALPALVQAQGTLAGSVRDTSGSVLPGVTVEASSPVLIERSRSTVTDSSGQYQIIDLRPGSYALKFTLPGFTTVEQAGVQVTGSGVISVNAEMRVGSVQETIVVTGESPVVDVQTSTRRQQVLDDEVVQALPASRGYGNYLAAVPGIQSTGFGSSAQPTTNFFSARGGRSGEGTIQIDGLNVGSSVGGGGVSGYLYDMANAVEVQVSIAGGLADVDRGGPAFNMIPKTGGNTFSGTYFGSFAGDWAQSSNLDDELRSIGFADLPALIKNWDTNFALGGPVLRDRVWFFSNVRLVGTHQDVPNLYANRNAGDPAAWTYEPDTSVKVRSANAKRIGSTRLTWQATDKHKLGFYIDYTKNCTGSAYLEGGQQCREPGDGWTASGPGIGPGVPTTSPESGTIWDDRAKILQGSYSAPLSSRVLVEAGVSSFFTKWGDIRPHGALTDFIPVTEQLSNAVTATPFSNFVYRGWNATGSTDQQHATFRGSVSYVTGSHSLKTGYQGGYLVGKSTTMVGSQISYRFSNRVPNQLTQRVGSSMTSNRVRYHAVYVQDQWTRDRLTLQGGLRYENASSWFPEGENGIIEAHRFGPAFTFPRTEGVRGYHDITPRMGAAYDVFGNGRTALKVSMSKYLQSPYAGEAYTIGNPGVTLVQTTSRSWTDPNGDRIAQCDFMNPVANGECGPWSDLNWGRSVQTTEANPDVLGGWGVRNWDWQFSAGVQQALLPGMSVEASYSRRWWGNFFVTHNRALGPSDYDEATLTAPPDPRLPGGGGYPVTFLTRNNNQALGVTSPYYTATSDFGDDTFFWHGVDIAVNARTDFGLLLQGGTSTGRGVVDTCEVEIGRFGRPLRVVDGTPACSVTEPWLTNFRGLASYTIPKADVLISAIVRSQPNAQPGGDVATNGASRAANYQMNAAQFLAATGRPLRQGVTTETVNLLLQGDVYGERVNSVDLRVGKILRFAGKRANIGLDLYNLFNSNTPTTYEAVYDPATAGARWMRPTAVLQPRFLRFNVQFDF